MNDAITELLRDLSGDDASSFIDWEGLTKVDEFISQSLLPLIFKANLGDNGYNLYKLIENAHTYWRNILSLPWIKDKATIAFMGRFSAGKSSVINSILGEKLLPVDVTPTTAVPTYITFGPELCIRAIDNDRNIKSIRKSVFSSLTKDALEGFPVAKLIRYFVIEYKNESLLNKSILDTPGYDSLDAIDRERALEVVEESNIIFWVMDINDGDLSKDAVKFIKDNLDGKAISVIINKADKKSPAERGKIVKKVRDTLTQKDIKYDNCILYSSINDGLKKGLWDILEQVQYSSMADYKQFIIEQIDEIIEYVNDFVANYKKELADMESLRGEVERNKEKIPKKVYKKVDKMMKDLFSKVRKSYISDDLVIERQYWDAFHDEIGEIACYAAEKYFELGYKHKRLEWIEHNIEVMQGIIKDIEDLRKEAHQVKANFKHIIEGVL